MLPYGVAEDVISTLKGSSAMARTAAGLEQALNRTKAAEHARTERRRRNHRVVNAGGGPIYAKDCREMAIQRIANEAAQQQAAVDARARRAIVTRFNTWRRITSALRNWGKKSVKRHAQGALITLTRPSMTVFTGLIKKGEPGGPDELKDWEYIVEDLALAERFLDLYTKSIQYIERRGALRFIGITESASTALEVALVNCNSMEPYL
ncbi:hypothetical protein PMIN06_013133 [Paraphaeosphaeria minitans]